MKFTPGKLAGMKAVSNERGVIAAAAMDQRGSLQKALAKEKGGTVGDHDIEEFKSLVTEVLTPHASAILLDPEWGLPASKRRAKNAGLLMAYEKTGYDASGDGPAGRSPRPLVGSTAQGSRRRLHQDPALLHALRRQGDQRQEACVGRAHRRRVPRQRHPVLPGVRRLRRGRRREGARVREEEAVDRHRQHGRVHQGALRRGRHEGRDADQHEVRRRHHVVRRTEGVLESRGHGLLPAISGRRDTAVHLPLGRRQQPGVHRVARARGRSGDAVLGRPVRSRDVERRHRRSTGRTGRMRSGSGWKSRA